MKACSNAQRSCDRKIFGNLRTAIIINKPVRLQRIIYHKKSHGSFLRFYKTRANMQQVLPVQAGLYRCDEWMAEVESRTQGSRPRPRTAFPRTDPLEAKDQGHKRKCSPKKKGLHKNFLVDLQKKKKCCPRVKDRPIFEDLRPRGQGQGLEFEAKAKDFKICPRGQGRP